MKVWENSKKLWKHSPTARVPTAFLVLPNLHSCFYNSIGTRKMFSISQIKYISKTCMPSPIVEQGVVLNLVQISGLFVNKAMTIREWF